MDKIFNDPIHGSIALHPVCVKIVDTPQFQRLRRIKQLGGAYLVYSGASHNRFEHSIGVCHLAGEFARHLQREQPNLNINDIDVLCVEIAGLCHDLGHGPYSHLFEKQFIKKIDKGWEHEKASIAMFQHLLDENADAEIWKDKENTENVKEKYEDIKFIDKKDVALIKLLINPPKEDILQKWNLTGRSKEKKFLLQIVANKENNIDVDRWDYFARDCLHLGLSNSFDHLRLMKFGRVIAEDSNSDKPWKICFRDKEASNVYEMFYTRSVLHRRAYQHKKTSIIEDRLGEALMKAKDGRLITDSAGQQFSIFEVISKMIDYIKREDNDVNEDNDVTEGIILYEKLDDSIFDKIRVNEGLRSAREILTRIEKRDIPKCLFDKPTTLDSNFIEKELKDKIKTYAEENHPLNTSFVESLILKPVYIEYGIKTNNEEENPFEHVKFYRKQNQDKAIKIQISEVSSMYPNKFKETFLRIYAEKKTMQQTEEEELKTKLEEILKEICDEYNGEQIAAPE